MLELKACAVTVQLWCMSVMQWQETGKGAEAGRRQRQRQEAGRGQRQEVGQKQEEDRGRGISEIEFSLVHRESSRRARPTY